MSKLIIRGLKPILPTYIPPTPGDPYWNNVAFLLHGNGANGSTAIVDEKGGIFTANGNCSISTTQSLFNGSSIHFGGTNGYISTPNNASHSVASGDFTLEFFVYTAATIAQCAIALLIDAANATYAQVRCSLGVRSAGAFYFLTEYPPGSWQYSNSVGALLANTWTHVAMVVRSGTAYMYVNGALVVSYASPQRVTNTGPTYIGGNLPGAPQWMNGYMAVIRHTVGVARYTANFTPPATPFPDHA